MELKVLIILLIVVSAVSVRAEELQVGRARVVDGDTIEIGIARIRLRGVDAPESSQLCKRGDGKQYRCGQESANALDRFLAASRPTTCALQYQDRNKRWVGDCRRADGVNVSQWLVKSGHAIDWRKYSAGRYSRLQLQARVAKKGIWQGEFEMPCSVRDRRYYRSSTCE